LTPRTDEPTPNSHQIGFFLWHLEKERKGKRKKEFAEGCFLPMRKNERKNFIWNVVNGCTVNMVHHFVRLKMTINTANQHQNFHQAHASEKLVGQNADRWDLFSKKLRYSPLS